MINKTFILFNKFIDTMLALFISTFIIYAMYSDKVDIINLSIFLASMLIYYISIWRTNYVSQVILRALTLAIIVISGVLIYKGTNNIVSDFFKIYYFEITMFFSFLFFVNTFFYYINQNKIKKREVQRKKKLREEREKREKKERGKIYNRINSSLNELSQEVILIKNIITK